MFVIETKNAKAAKKMSVVMGIAFALSASFGLLLTMHTYVKPSPAPARGFRVFGFPRQGAQSSVVTMSDIRTEPASSDERLRQRKKGNRLGIFLVVLGLVLALVGMVNDGYEASWDDGVRALGFILLIFGYPLARLWFWFKAVYKN
jgi:multisubunit Na+/H+ antiporter MnhG subunit